MSRVSERVLNEDGTFSDFPERLIEKSVERGERAPLPEPSKDPLISHGEKTKSELASKTKNK